MSELAVSAAPKLEIVSDDLNFELIYEGPEVDDGSISARNLLSALSGITEGFARIASEYESTPPYDLRVRDIAPGSVQILFRVVEFAKSNPAATAGLAAVGATIVTALSNSLTGLYRVIKDLAESIEAKKKLKGARVATTAATFEEGYVLLLVEGDPIRLTREQYELLLSRRIDDQLAKIVSPLKAGQVNRLRVEQNGQELATVDVSDRAAFDRVEISETKVREETSIEGTLNSLSKTNMRGTFFTTKGAHVPYRYVGGNLAELFRGFAAREPVRVHGKVKYGSDGIPISVEVETIEALQSSFLLG